MRRNQPSRTNGEDRAVSEVLSFVLVFGIILTGVAVLSMTGFQAMEDYQDTEQLRNGERAMDALADNFNDVLRYDGIDQRYGELSLRDGTVTTGDDGTVVTLDIDGNEETHNLGEFAYHYNDETIAYEGGAMIRESDSGGVIRKDPWLDCRDSTAIVSLVKVDADDRSIQSSDGVGFTMSVEDRSSETYEHDSVSVEVENSEYDAWDEYEWRCGDDIERVHVTIATVDIEY